MFRTENQEIFARMLKAFSEAAHKNYGTHAYEAGYLQSLCVSLLGQMPKKYQQAWINDVVYAMVRQEREAAEKLNKTAERA